MKNIHKINENIYITNDEEIKEGDYFWKPDCNMIFRAEYTPHKGCQKVILTTDQDLIKDGVQAIDDDFLEWFVKNPSCEEVEVQCRYNFYAGKDLTHYKIIIPKEETTAYHYLSCCRSIEECHCGKYPKQIKCYCGHTTMCDCSPIDKLTQQTLEEAAERIAMTKDWDFESSEGNGYYDYVEGFTEGAKWQQERMYSEEEVLDILDRFLLSMVKDEKTGLIEKWFEQFKKK